MWLCLCVCSSDSRWRKHGDQIKHFGVAQSVQAIEQGVSKRTFLVTQYEQVQCPGVNKCTFMGWPKLSKCTFYGWTGINKYTFYTFYHVHTYTYTWPYSFRIKPLKQIFHFSCFICPCKVSHGERFAHLARQKCLKKQPTWTNLIYILVQW